MKSWVPELQQARGLEEDASKGMAHSKPFTHQDSKNGSQPNEL